MTLKYGQADIRAVKSQRAGASLYKDLSVILNREGWDVGGIYNTDMVRMSKFLHKC